MDFNIDDYYAVERASIHDDMDRRIEVTFARADPLREDCPVVKPSVTIPMLGADALPTSVLLTLKRQNGDEAWEIDVRCDLVTATRTEATYDVDEIASRWEREHGGPEYDSIQVDA